MTDLHPALVGLVAGGTLLGVLSGLVAYVTLLERKFAARMQFNKRQAHLGMLAAVAACGMRGLLG